MVRNGYRRVWRTRLAEVPNPGAEWELRAPGNAWWRVVSLVATLVTDATVANRRVRLVAGDGTNRWYAAIASADQAATATVEYGAFDGADSGGLATAGLTVPLPNGGLLLRPGHRLQSVTVNIQAGDQWSGINALIDEIPSDDPYVSLVGASLHLPTNEVRSGND